MAENATAVEQTVINFPSNPTPATLETCLADVRQNVGQAVRMPLLHKWGGGYGAAAQSVQTLASWAQLNESPRVVRVPDAFFQGAESRDRFASTLAGMSSLYFADRIDGSTDSIGRYEGLLAVAPRVDAMQQSRFGDTVRGLGVALCCFAGARGEFLPSLYETAAYGGVRGVAGFHVLLPRLLTEIGGRAAQRLPDGQVEHLSQLVYELFANADEHGSFDVHGDALPTAIRGISLRHHGFGDLSQYISTTGQDNPLRAYLAKAAVLPVAFGAKATAKEKPPPESAHFLEISVFDCGPGLPLRWLSKHAGRASYAEIDEQEELWAIQTCFEKHATTRSLAGSGQGLTHALSIMKRLKAFMVLRTGRMSMFQDFTRASTTEFRPLPRFGQKKLQLIAGTSFTICFRIK